MSTQYTAYTHPRAGFAIGRAAVLARRILEKDGFEPPLERVGDAAYDTTVWIDDLEETGYLCETEAAIARQIAFTAMARPGRWKPRCIRRSLGAQACWEAEIVAAARRIKTLVLTQAGLFEPAESTATAAAPTPPRKLRCTPNALALFSSWLDAEARALGARPPVYRVDKAEHERRVRDLLIAIGESAQNDLGFTRKQRKPAVTWGDVAVAAAHVPTTPEEKEEAARKRAKWASNRGRKGKSIGYDVSGQRLMFEATR